MKRNTKNTKKHKRNTQTYIIIIIITSLLRVDRMQPNNKCK